MVKKFVFLAGVGVGYLVGSKGGREKLMELWKDPKVQETVSQGTEWAKEKAPGLQEKVSEVASTAKDKVTHSSDSAEPGGESGASTGTPGAPSSSVAGTGSAGSTDPFSSPGQHTASPGGAKPENKQ